ncbi:Enoyl-CoA delta isomerase 2, mitochondrial [Hypsibius exemplaris]|uniref:Enoyl-CoA delta isomerase 2, mitochondrial n=1 Tax=Hypsibius exemplaris TaxID=2072580 RepID=A0A9X6RL14_HYPEX|nr:Enoyl-CoA delta isomerase 2, mitochondrial [Hypsibius exemplaris]
MLRRFGASVCSSLQAGRHSTFLNFSRAFAAQVKTFEEAKEKLGTLSEEPGPDIKLRVYGLFKQATVGTCNAKKPGMMDIVGKAKWNAWNDLGSISKEDAQKQYVDLVNELLKADSGAESSSAGTHHDGDSGKYKETLYREEGKITYITLNRPQKFNSLTPTGYIELTDALESAAKNKTVATVITGAGKYFSSGNDLSNVAKAGIDKAAIKDIAEKSAVMLEKFVSAFIDHPKLLVGLVHGPCIGIAFTTMALYDVVYASDQATFHAPFTSLGLTPEGTSSYSFPKVMGPAKANEVLLLGKKLSAAEALECGFVTEVFPADTFEVETKRRLELLPKLAPISLKESKILIRSLDQAKLHKVNDLECKRLIGMWQGDECLSAAAKFLSRK